MQPVATAAAQPPLDPPAMRFGSRGFVVRPKSSFSVRGPNANSGQFVLAIRIAPAARIRATAGASSAGTLSSRKRLPQVVRAPPTAIASLTVNGTPWSGPTGSLDSARLASARAACSKVAVMALQGSSAQRSRCAWTISTGETSRAAISSASRVAERLVYSGTGGTY